MIAAATGAETSALARLVDEVATHLHALLGDDHGHYVGSELAAVDRALYRIRAEGLARGPVFCEWGSGLGGVSAVAALHGFTAAGIEIRSDLVAAARSLAALLGLSTAFAEGTFLLPGDEDLTADAGVHTGISCAHDAWDELRLAPADCDVVFAYPWPGEEAFIDAVFARHATSGALLLTFHDFDRVLVQRKVVDQPTLRTIGWR